MDEQTIGWTCQWIGKKGLAQVRATAGDELLFTDTMMLGGATDRTAFAKAIAEKYETLDQAEIEQALLELFARAARRPPDRPDPDKRMIPYEETSAGIFQIKETDDGPIRLPLTNFTARIIADVVRDDGVEQTHAFEIEATLHDRTRQFAVPASRFAALHWAPEHLGAAAAVVPGFTVRDHARFAIQQLSGDPPRRVRYTHTGWRRIDDEWIYLHAGGAIGPNGPVEGIETGLDDRLAKYELPAIPTEEQAIQEAIRASIGMLDVGRHRVSVPVWCSVWRSVLGPCDFGEHLAGGTGVFKTELAALAQQHFGAGMDARNLPGSWSSTGNALEGLAFCAKDALLVVDDFAPTGSSFDVQRYHREADRVLRAQGNRSGRGRMAADGSLRSSKPPRGLILSTGEDVPRGQSVRARLLIVEVEPDDIGSDELTVCQHAAADGQYAAAMVAYLQWLASHHEEVWSSIPTARSDLREQATLAGMHRRTPAIIAELLLGAHVFLRFAEGTGAVDGARRAELTDLIWSALSEVGEAQAAQQRASDPATRFLELLAGALASGAAHVAGVDGDEPVEPERWGWRQRTIGTGDRGRDEWQPQGARIGWADADDLYLEPEAALAAAQRMAAGTGDGITIAGRTLHKRLRERGLLASVDDGRRRLVVRVVLEGARRTVLHLKAPGLSLRQERPNGPIRPTEAPEPALEAANADSWAAQWAVSEEEGAETAHEGGPSESLSGGDGPNGPFGPLSAHQEDLKI